jgi:pilus assembly protein Flp/PilA
VETGESRYSYQEVALKRIFSKFFTDQSAATAIEYGLIAAGISIATITAVYGLGTTLNDNHSSVSRALK